MRGEVIGTDKGGQGAPQLIKGVEIYATLSSDEFKFAHKKSRDSLKSLLSQ